VSKLTEYHQGGVKLTEYHQGGVRIN
jgi:hypothetical protein